MNVSMIKKIIAGIALVTAIGLQIHTLFLKPLEGDYVAYGLAAANWVMGGEFATPQVGSQYEMDHLWHFNSPLLGLGAAPFFWVGDIGHDWYMLGCVLQMLFCLWVFVWLNLKAVGDGKWPEAIALTVAFLTTRIYMGEFLNQRYSTVSYAALGVLFFPFRRVDEKASGLQWCIAGMLPLIHPALLPASVVWVVVEAVHAFVCRRWLISKGSQGGFLLGVGLSALWYLDLRGLETQFLPHLQSRTFVPFSGWNMFLSYVFGLPSKATFLMIVLMISMAAVSRVSDESDRVSRLRIGAMLLLVLMMDARGQMPYLGYYLIGMAPAGYCMIRNARLRKWLVVTFATLGFLQVIVEVRMFEPVMYRPLSRSAAYEFLVSNSRPGDCIVVGPPFILSSASDANLPEGRSIRMVVPMPFYLKDFDVNLYLKDIRESATVYIGKPEYYDGVQLYYKSQSPPVFEPYQSETVRLQAMPILIARPLQKSGK